MGLSKLGALVGVSPTKKKRASDKLSAMHKLGKEAVTGVRRVYQPFDEKDRDIPNDESKQCPTSVQRELQSLRDDWINWVDVAISQEFGNAQAKGDIVFDEDGNQRVVATGIPVGALLFLEKRLEDMSTLVDGLTTLPTDRDWNKDANTGLWVTPPTESVRKMRQKKPLELAKATDKHPAQVTLVDDEVPVGKTIITYVSGAITRVQQRQLQNRVRTLLDAVKKAREQANALEVENKKLGEYLFDLVFAGVQEQTTAAL